ncbi:MAG: hypothetical protein Q7N50_06110 [Armatimonadota bacterium]|nr:hypothetical protein [Armatimonadota bacterium]
MDDHKYSVGRTVVFRLPQHGQAKSVSRWAGKASGSIKNVRLADEAEPHWIYTIERQRTKERFEVGEDDILYGVAGKRRRESLAEKEAPEEKLASAIDRLASDSMLANFLRTTVNDLVKREQLEETARREGRELPLKEGDYIRVRGDLREEMGKFHNYYGKIIDVFDSDIAGLEAKPDKKGEPRTYRTLKKYAVFLDEGNLVEIYDPEVKLYYTSNGRSTILNWRAATFLAEAFGDDPPYNLEFSYLEDHIFTRDELKAMMMEQLAELLASMLYVKGHMGWRDFQQQRKRFAELSVEYLTDSALAASRFDQRKNRPMTREEIEEKRLQARKFKELLGR